MVRSESSSQVQMPGSGSFQISTTDPGEPFHQDSPETLADAARNSEQGSLFPELMHFTRLFIKANKARGLILSSTFQAASGTCTICLKIFVRITTPKGVFFSVT
jgi:hypothetical protein